MKCPAARLYMRVGTHARSLQRKGEGRAFTPFAHISGHLADVSVRRTCLSWAREQLKVTIQAQLGWTGSNVTSSMQGVSFKCASQCSEAPPGHAPLVTHLAGL